MRKLILATALFGSICTANAQDPAGNAFHIDYDQFQIDNVLHYINCGNDASFNVGANMTMELWLRPYSTAWNQKLAGKLNGNFNSGYMMAIDQGKLYPEIWTPGQSQLLSGFLPPTPTPYYWVHLAITYDGSNLTAYVNGEEVGQTNASGAVASNNDPFIIGIAPWDLSNFQAFGDFDELRVWNTARTQQELLDNMFVQLTGSETGLVAYYDFNVDTGTNLPDLSPNGNDGTVTGTMAVSGWEPSRAVIGDAAMSTQNDINALWNALAFSDPRFVTTTNGLSLLASGIPDYDYIVFGHDSGSGVSTADNPAGAPADFEHSGRSWYLNNVGGFASDMIFDLTNVADGGTVLDATQPAENYTLLHRTGTSGAYTAVGSGNSISGNIVTFSSQLAADGYYAIGVASTQTYNDASLLEKQDFEFGLYPNPADDQLTIQLPTVLSGQLEIFNAVGQLVLTQELEKAVNQTVDIDELASGVYSVVISTQDKLTSHKRLIVE